MVTQRIHLTCESNVIFLNLKLLKCFNSIFTEFCKALRGLDWDSTVSDLIKYNLIL